MLWDCPTWKKLGTDLLQINSHFASLRSVGIRWIHELHSPRFRKLIQPRGSPCVQNESQHADFPKNKSGRELLLLDSFDRFGVAVRMPKEPALPRFF